MNPITDLVFIVTWLLLLVWAIRTMSRGWGLSQPVERVKPPDGVWTTQVKKPVHPEMADVKPGEELMGVTFKQDPQDPLYKSLQERIDEMEDDEDDGGDIMALNR